MLTGRPQPVDALRQEADPGHPRPRLLRCSSRAARRPDLRWHDLRHTGAVLPADWRDARRARGALGHSTHEAALRYQHAAQRRDMEIAKRLSAMVTSKIPDPSVGNDSSMCDIRTMEAVRSAQELGERIREARIASGLQQGVLAKRVGMDRSALVRVESGERKVSAVELFGLAEALDFPLSYFVYKPEPAIVSKRSELSEDDGDATKARYRADALLQAFARDAEWLRVEGYLPMVDLPEFRFRSAEDARGAAIALRRQLKLRGPLDSLVAVAEEAGLYVRVTPAVREDGSSLTPLRGFGVALVSSYQEPGRRRFTVAHELGHHLLGDEYSSDIGVAASKDERESWIDSFAAELLLPRKELKREWSKLKDLSLRDRLVTLAAAYRVSWTSLIDSIRWAELLPGEELGPLRAQTPVRGEFIALLGTEPAEDVRAGSTGPVWRRAVMRAYSDGRLTRARTTELLAGGIAESDLPDVGREPLP